MVCGVWFCSKFLNSFIPEAADERALNVPKPGKALGGSARRENHRLCLNSLKALGRIPKIDPRSLAMGEVCVREHCPLLILVAQDGTLCKGEKYCISRSKDTGVLYCAMPYKCTPWCLPFSILIASSV